MSVAGVGIDLVDIAPFRALCGTVVPGVHSHFVDATFTLDELRDSEKGATGDVILHLAARYAAKEAALKALDCAAAALGLAPPTISPVEVEVVKDARGRPTLRFHGRALALKDALEIDRWHVSLTHELATAGAVVVVERR